MNYELVAKKAKLRYDTEQENEMARTRSEVLDNWMKKALEDVTTEALYESNLPTELFHDHEPQWWEIRESIMRVLFEMNDEQVRLEIHAAYVRENCL